MSKSASWLVAVTGSQKPYIFDLPHLLSLPNGFEFRFRYKPQWVATDLQAEIDDEKKAKELAGRELLVVFHSQETKRLIALRRCKVLSLERLGPLVFLRFRLGPFVKVNLATVLDPNREEQVQKESTRLTGLGRELLKLGEADLSEPLTDGLYLFRAEGLPADLQSNQEPQSLAWAAQVALVMDEPNLNAIPLFQFLGFQKKDGEFLIASDLRGSFTVSKEHISGFKLIEGERYRARLLQWRNERTPPFRVVCDVNEVALRLEGKSDLVVGKYDVLEFAIMAERTGYCEILLRVERARGEATGAAGCGPEKQSHELGDSAEETWPSVYTARVPVIVRKNRFLILMRGVFALLGFLLYTTSATVADAALKWAAGVLSMHEPSTELAANALQVTGLALMFFAFGDLAERILGPWERLKGFFASWVHPSGK